jgi:TPR repeat protein
MKSLCGRLLVVGLLVGFFGFSVLVSAGSADFELSRKSAEQGDVTHQFLLGSMYEEGREVPQDYKRAMKWYRKAAEQKNIASQYILGRMYHTGQGVSQDYKEAEKWLRKVAELKGYATFDAKFVANAQYILAMSYEYGHGVIQDYVQAHKWWNISSASGLTLDKGVEAISKYRINTMTKA